MVSVVLLFWGLGRIHLNCFETAYSKFNKIRGSDGAAAADPLQLGKLRWFQGPGLAKPGCDTQIIQLAAREEVLAGWVQWYPLPGDLGVTVAFMLRGIFCWLPETEICWCNSGRRPVGGDCLKGKGMECRKNNKIKMLQLFSKWLAIPNALVWIQNDLLHGRVLLNCIQKSYLPLGKYPCFYAC